MYVGILLPNALFIFKSIQIDLWSLGNGPNEDYSAALGVKEAEIKPPSIGFCHGSTLVVEQILNLLKYCFFQSHSIKPCRYSLRAQVLVCVRVQVYH